MYFSTHSLGSTKLRNGELQKVILGDKVMCYQDYSGVVLRWSEKEENGNKEKAMVIVTRWSPEGLDLSSGVRTYTQKNYTKKISSWAITNPKRWCCESSTVNLPANLENSALARRLENVSFHCNPKERQFQRMLKLQDNCTLLTHY